MLGVPRPEGVGSAVNNGGNGGAPGDHAQKGFAESEAGKGLANALCLTPPPAEAAK